MAYGGLYGGAAAAAAKLPDWYTQYQNAPVSPALAPSSGQNYSQLGSMLAGLGATGAASLVSGPFAPLVGFGVQQGLQYLLGGREQDELRDMARQRARAQSLLIPQLQAQAAGRPSAASRAIQEQIRQQLDMSRQAAATSAGRAGQYGTAVARANQFRSQQALASATALQQGQLQQFSQQQIMGLPAVQLQGGLAIYEQQQRATISTFIQSLLATPDADLTDMKREIKRLLGELNQYSEQYR